MHLPKLHEVFLELLRGQFKVEAADEDFTLRVGELDAVFRVIAASHAVFLDDLHVRIRLLNLLPIVGHHEVVVLVMATASVASMVVMATAAATSAHIAAITATLVVISRLDINSFVEDPVALRLVLANDTSFDLLCLVLVVEAQQHETEASAPLGDLLTHHDRILDLAKLLEVLL